MLLFSDNLHCSHNTDPLIPVHTEEPCVVPFLHNDKGNTRLIVLLQFDARFTDGQQLMLKNLESKLSECWPTEKLLFISKVLSWGSPCYLVELSLWDAVAVVDDSGGLEASRFVELDEQLSHHSSQVLDNVLAVLLHTDRGTVTTGMSIHAPDDLMRGHPQTAVTLAQLLLMHSLSVKSLLCCLQYAFYVLSSLASQTLSLSSCSFLKENFSGCL